jgi:Fe2+ transport system protein FeoA
MDHTKLALRAAEARRIAELPDDALVTRRQVAILKGCHPNTTIELERRGVLPPPIRFCERGWARWRLGDIRAHF